MNDSEQKQKLKKVNWTYWETSTNICKVTMFKTSNYLNLNLSNS